MGKQKNQPASGPSLPSKNEAGNGQVNAPLFSRRNFLRVAFFGIPALAAAITVEAKKNAAPEGSAITVETANATFNVVHSNHNIPTDPRIVDDVDGIVIELFGLNMDTEESIRTSIEQASRHVQYAELFRRAATLHKPIFIADISHKLKDVSNRQGKTAETLEIGEAVVGVGALGFNVGHTLLSQRSQTPAPGLTSATKVMDRRSWLSLVKDGLSAAAVYLLGPHVERQLEATKVLDEHTRTRQAYRLVKDINAVVHPEMRSLAIEGRDAVIAEKASASAAWVASAHNIAKPRIAVVVGGAHTGVADMLQQPSTERTRVFGSFVTPDQIPEERFILRIEPEVSMRDNSLFLRYSLMEDAAFKK